MPADEEKAERSNQEVLMRDDLRNVWIDNQDTFGVATNAKGQTFAVLAGTYEEDGIIMNVILLNSVREEGPVTWVQLNSDEAKNYSITENRTSVVRPGFPAMEESDFDEVRFALRQTNWDAEKTRLTIADLEASQEITN